MTEEELRAAPARPEMYPSDPAEVRVLETHISWVFLAGERAYKLKKPIVLRAAEVEAVGRSLASSGSFEPLDEIPSAARLPVDTDRAVEDVGEGVVAGLDRTLAPAGDHQ